MRLLLIDATSYIFRAFHAVGDLRTRDGQPTGAIYGFIKMLDKLRRTMPAEHIACVMDVGGKNFRHDIDERYKANRPPPDADLAAQFEPAKDFVRAMGFPQVGVAGVEADDVIATLAKKGAAKGWEVIIASGDKDLMQLVDAQVTVYDSMKERRYDDEGVFSKFAVRPCQMADYLALVGDTSDNITGVYKVGAKTAAKWLEQYESLDNIISHASEIKGKVGENLRTAITDGALDKARRLVALLDDVAIDEDAAWLVQAPNIKQWQELCERYEFRQLTNSLEWSTRALPAEKEQRRAGCIYINDKAKLRRLATLAEKNGILSIDTETVGSPAMQAQIVGFSVAVNADEAYYVPLAHTDNATPQLDINVALDIIRIPLENPAVVKITHNGKYDTHIFANYGIHFAGVVEDTKIAAYVADASANNKLKTLAARHLGVDTTSFKDVVDGKNIKDFSEVDVQTATHYAAEDAEITWKLKTAVIDKLTGKAADIYQKIDRPLMPVLAAIERAGVLINSDELNIFAADMRERMLQLEKQAHEIAGESFNLNSPRQLEVLLFDKFKAVSVHKTAQGKARSTDERTLEKLSADFPLAKTVLEHRTLAKLVGTYAEKLPRMLHPQTGRIHTDYNQSSVITGRLASATPNLQNIPVRDEAGRRIRRCFIAAAGKTLISADYSQIELRLMAHLSGDAAMTAAFADGADIHRQTAAEIFGDDEVSEQNRRAAKAINFGLIYGMSAFGLARSIGISRTQAQYYIDRYFCRYPGVAEYMAHTRKTALENGAVNTIFGRSVPLSTTSGGAQKRAIERAAINAPMQGSAADLIKIAMIAIHSWLEENKMKTKMVMQVHDELVLEAPQEEEAEICAKLPELMCATPLDVPLEVNIKSANNWDAAH